MIPKDIIDSIFETARIEEVVGDFVSLKKEALTYWAFVLFMMKKHPLSLYLLPKVFTNVLAVERR